MLPNLKSPETYQAVLASLAKKWAKRGRLDRLEVGELTLVELQGRTDALSRILAKTVWAGEYRLSPLVPRRGRFEGKERIIYRPNLLDAVVLTILARYLSVSCEPDLAPTLHSYRVGHSSWKALEQLSDFLGVYRAAVTVRERGLYVIRRDVAKYGETIPTHTDSILRRNLHRVINRDDDERRRQIVDGLVDAALVQPILWSDGSVSSLPRGIPTGSPIQPPLLNVYLAPLDAELASISGSFYSRFGDDVLFMHSDLDAVLRASRRFDEMLEERGLTSNETKRQDLYFNGAGRAAERPCSFRPTQCLEYLGARVSFSGKLGLKLEHFRRLLRALRARLCNLSESGRGFGREDRLRLLCVATRRALDPTDALALPGADRLHAALNDRSQMRDFDYRIALYIAELIDGRRGVRAFRKVPIELQRRFGAYSIEAERRRMVRPAHYPTTTEAFRAIQGPRKSKAERR